MEQPVTGFIIQKGNNEFSLEIVLLVIGAAGNIARSNIALAHLWLKLTTGNGGESAYPPQTASAGADAGTGLLRESPGWAGANADAVAMPGYFNTYVRQRTYPQGNTCAQSLLSSNAAFQFIEPTFRYCV